MAGGVSAAVATALWSQADALIMLGGSAAASTGSLPNASVGGSYFYALTPQAAYQPSTFSLTVTSGTNPYYISRTGTLYVAPTTAETGQLQVTETGADGTTYITTKSLVCDSVMRANGYLRSRTGAQPLAGGYQSTKYQLQLQGAGGGTGASQTHAVTAGSLPTGLSLSTGGLITGTPSATGTFTFTDTITDSGSNSCSVQYSITIGATSQVSRPGYNTGTGFFVDGNGILRDPNGYAFRIRGLNRTHYDSIEWVSGASGALTGANTVRVFQFWASGGITDWPLAMGSQNQYPYMLVIPTCSSYDGTNGTSGNTSTADLAIALGNWYSNFSILSPYLNRIICNIANEWGPAASTAWQYAYEYCESAISNISGRTITCSSSATTNPFINCPFAVIKGAGGISDQVVNLSSPGGSQGAWTVTSSVSLSGYTSGGALYGGAVGVMRAAGYTCPLLIDTGGSGQDETDLTSYAQAIQASDPQQNCVFSYHLYGSTTDTEVAIQGITNASQAVVSLKYPYSSPNIHPFSGSYTGISPNNSTYNGVTSYTVTGVLGMTQINGLQPCSANNLGGVQGTTPWQVWLTVNSTSYGTYTSGGTIREFSFYSDRIARLAALASSGVCIIVGEFGPGRNIGASPTLVSPDEVVSACEANNVGWIYWALDDHDETNGSSSNNWFGCTPWVNSSEATNGAGYWDGKPSALTEQGLSVILNPNAGLGFLATPAQSFL